MLNIFLKCVSYIVVADISQNLKRFSSGVILALINIWQVCGDILVVSSRGERLRGMLLVLVGRN